MGTQIWTVTRFGSTRTALIRHGSHSAVPVVLSVLPYRKPPGQRGFTWIVRFEGRQIAAASSRISAQRAADTYIATYETTEAA